MKQDTIQATPFELVYDRTATLPVEIEVNTTADNIQKSQEKQKERHDNQLLKKPVEFKIGDKVLLHCTKAEKQWNRKFDPKWNRPFHIEEIIGNGAYKLRWDNKILAKAAHSNRLRLYHHIVSPSINNILQLGVQRILVQPDEIP
ncbi:hypothetical protein G9A89_018716 [Geosiphon pyriformis]|nr:hypothetical protein G9A89_018716 [Geosiphon pyriformis]